MLMFNEHVSSKHLCADSTTSMTVLYKNVDTIQLHLQLLVCMLTSCIMLVCIPLLPKHLENSLNALH